MSSNRRARPLNWTKVLTESQYSTIRNGCFCLPPVAGSSDDSFEDRSSGHIEPLGQLCQGAKGHVYFAALDFAHVGAIESANVGKVLLRPAAGRSQFANPVAECGLQ